MLEVLKASADWDQVMLGVAFQIARMSKDPKCKVGAVLVSPNRRQVAFGYNGFPSAVPDLARWWNTKEGPDGDFGKFDLCNHAEENAISQAQRCVVGWTLYCTHQPCLRCARRIVTEELSRVVFAIALEDKENNWGFDKAEYLFRCSKMQMDHIEVGEQPNA